MKKVVGKIIGISELNVKILLYNQEIKIRDVLSCEFEGKFYKFEVVEIESNIAHAIPFKRVAGLKKGIDVEFEEGGLQIEYSDEILGKVFDPFGENIDEKTFDSIKKEMYMKENYLLKKFLLKMSLYGQELKH